MFHFRKKEAAKKTAVNKPFVSFEEVCKYYQMGEQRIISSQAGEFLARLLELVESGQGNVRHGRFQ